MVAVVLMAGDHVPVIGAPVCVELLLDEVGNVKLPPEHIAGTCVKVGVVNGFTVTVMVAVPAH